MNTAAIPYFEFRTVGAALPACATTLLLIFGMHQLIDRDYVEIDTTEAPRIMPFIQETPPPLIDEFERPEKIDEPQTPPPTLKPILSTPTSKVSIPTGEFKAVTKKKLPNIDMGGGNLVKQVAVAPVYPSRALQRGIEGFVDVQYDVTAYGGTTNVSVLYAEPEGVFERSALGAVARWKFRPQVVDDEAVATPNQRERIRFSIEK